MFLHLGQNTLVDDRTVIGVFDLDNSTVSKHTRAFLARAQREEGRWSFVPLDLLEEGEEPPQPAPAPVIQVDLKLVLEALRREKGESEQRRAAERIVRSENDFAWAGKVYPAFRRNTAYWEKKRCAQETGLFFYDSEADDPEQRDLEARWESGWDNAVRWDRSD